MVAEETDRISCFSNCWLTSIICDILTISKNWYALGRSTLYTYILHIYIIHVYVLHIYIMVSTTARQASWIKTKRTHLNSLFSQWFHMSGTTVSSNSTGTDTKRLRHTSEDNSTHKRERCCLFVSRVSPIVIMLDISNTCS